MTLSYDRDVGTETLRVLMGFLSSDARAIHLLSQNPDDTDEEEEVHLPAE